MKIIVLYYKIILQLPEILLRQPHLHESLVGGWLSIEPMLKEEEVKCRLH